jgi:hypothetical protein
MCPGDEGRSGWIWLCVYGDEATLSHPAFELFLDALIEEDISTVKLV